MIKSANLSFSLLMWIVSSIVVVLLAPTGLSDSNAAVCPSLSDPMSGDVMYSSNSTLEDMYISGTAATYSCSRGELFGNITRNCLESGNWTDTAPFCAAYCQSLSDPDDGKVMYSTTENHMNHYPSMTVATLTCNIGFKLEGHTNLTCVDSGDESTGSGIWNHTLPTCELVDCGSLPSILNGIPGTPFNTTFRETVTYNCSSGYILLGSATVSCLASGNWSSRPTCTDIDECTSAEPPNCQHICHNTVGSYTCSCRSGHDLYNDGRTCHAVDCGSPSYVVSNGSPGNPSNITFGGTVTYNCNHGYFLSGSAEVSCLANGSWSLPPICRALEFTVKVSSGQSSSSSESIISGQDLQLSCVVRRVMLPSDALITYQWFQNSASLLSQMTEDYTLSSVEPSDAGEYDCAVNVSSNYIAGVFQNRSQLFELRVQFPTPTVSISLPQRIFVGESLNLTCTVELNYRLRMFDVPVIITVNISSPASQIPRTLHLGVGEQVLDSTNMHIRNIAKSDAGTYECRATLNAFDSSNPLIIGSEEGIGMQTITVYSVPSMPSNFRAHSQSRSIQLSWDPETGDDLVESYNITYSYRGNCSDYINLYEVNTVSVESQNSFTIWSLEEFSVYLFTITAVNGAGRSVYAETTTTTRPAAPEESLQNLTVSNLNATSISVQWKRSDCIEENGVISNYNVTYYLDAYPEHSSTQSVSVRDITEFTATDLLPRSNYTFEINVISESGRGPTVKIFSTTNASEGVTLQLNGMFYLNNSIIAPGDFGVFPFGLLCLTNYKLCCRREDTGLTGQGQWYFPNATNVELKFRSPLTFNMVRLKSLLALNREDSFLPNSGVYRCQIPVDSVRTENIYIGIYPPDSGIPAISNITFQRNFLNLTCVSSGGPVTTITWHKNSQLLSIDDTKYTQVQKIISTEMATYLSILIARNIADLVGNFTCTVMNERGHASKSMVLGGVRIVGGDTPFIVGHMAKLSCISDTVANKILWLENDNILAVSDSVHDQGVNHLNYTIHLVNDSIHGNIYTCQVQDASRDEMLTSVTTTISVTVPLIVLKTTITDEPDNVIPGVQYVLTCTVTKLLDGLINTPTVEWLDSGMNNIHGVNGISTTISNSGVSQLTFFQLKTSHAGSYVCQGNLSSPASPTELTQSVAHDISLQVPAAEVMLTRPKAILFAGFSEQVLNCTFRLKDTIDSEVRVNISWERFSYSAKESESQHVITPNGSLTGMSAMRFTNLSSKDENISCKAKVIPLANANFLRTSRESNFSIQLLVQGVFLRFNNTSIVNNSKFTVSDVGNDDHDKIRCYSDRSGCCMSSVPADSYEEWKFPNGSVVPKQNSTIFVTRENGFIGLNRINNETVPRGEYCCEAHDGRKIKRRVCIEIQGDELGQEARFIGGTAAAIVITILFLTVLFIFIIAILVRLHRQGKLTLAKLNYGKVRSKQCYIVTVDPSSSDFPLDDQNNSLTPSLNVLVRVTTFSEKETGTEGKEDGEEDYFEDAQFLRIGHNSSFSVADFPGHVIRMHGDEDNLFDIEYTSISEDPQSPHNESVKSHNRSKNRFANVFPYDFNRVKLKVVSDVSGSDFINASYVNGYMSNNKYIAAQGPLPNTLDDFWQMIWENRLPTIVMVTKCFEDRKKCECYWPMKEGKTLKMDNDIIVSLMSVITFADFSVRKLRVVCSSDPSSAPLEVTQFHYTAWPDHNVPSSGMSLIYFTRAVRKAHPRTEPKHLLVHCSAGVGRTGTFIVLDTMLEKIEKDGVINIYDCVTHIRKQRVLLVQTLSQYIFLHDALNELIACGETDIKAHNLRSVVDQLGVPAQDKATEGASVECQDSFTGFQKQFKVLEELSQPDESVDYYTAQNEENEDKNRYPSIIPNEENRVRLQFSSSGSDYINASFVHGYQQRRAYIATQGPLEHTTGDFWSMVVENQCSCIVMLCTLMEGEKQSSRRYWPKFKDVTETYGDFAVTQQSIEAFGDYVVRKLEVSKQASEATAVVSEPSLVVTQFHFTRWKAKEYPHHSASLLDLIQDVNRVQMNTNNKPIVVMCNNGIGRTGVFITLHAQLERLKIEGVIDVFQFIKSAREQREGLIDSAELYSFCHEALADYVDSFETYANFKELV